MKTSVLTVTLFQVPSEVDGTRGHPVRQVHRQVRRLELRNPSHGNFHLWPGSLSRYEAYTGLTVMYLRPFCLSGMNNKETIDQVERGYRMANPVHIVYPESKTHPKEVAQSQSNVYKVQDHSPPSSRPS